MAAPEGGQAAADGRLLGALQRLLAIDATEARPALDAAARLIEGAIRADRVA